jgi:hypothetical protein
MGKITWRNDIGEEALLLESLATRHFDVCRFQSSTTIAAW